MDREAWRAAIHGVAKSWTWLSDWTELNWRSTWLLIPRCLAVDEWSHHHDYLGHEDLFLFSSSVWLHFHFSLMHLRWNDNSLQCSYLENPRDGGAWWAAVYRIAQSRTQLSDFTFAFHFHALEKEMATQSSIFAWRIPETVGPCLRGRTELGTTEAT